MSTPNKRKGTRLEKRVVEQAQAAGLKAQKQPMSGQLTDYPSDAVIEQILVECKCGYESLNAAGEKTFTFQMEWMNKVEEHARKAGTNVGDVVLDSCMGSGTTCIAAMRTGRQYIGIEIREDYFTLAQNRLNAKEIAS